MRPLWRAALLPAALGLVAGCGGSDPSEPSGATSDAPEETVSVTEDAGQGGNEAAQGEPAEIPEGVPTPQLPGESTVFVPQAGDSGYWEVSYGAADLPTAEGVAEQLEADGMQLLSYLPSEGLHQWRFAMDGQIFELTLNAAEPRLYYIIWKPFV